jgi:hypothetical protein
LPIVKAKALGKEGRLCQCLATVALGKIAVTVTWPSFFFFLWREPLRHSAKSLPSARQKILGKELFAIECFAE